MHGSDLSTGKKGVGIKTEAAPEMALGLRVKTDARLLQLSNDVGEAGDSGCGDYLDSDGSWGRSPTGSLNSSISLSSPTNSNNTSPKSIILSPTSSSIHSSPGNSNSSSAGLTLEQFTDIVLAQEGIDPTTKKGKEVTSPPRQVILSQGQGAQVCQKQGSSQGEKLKPVVLTPRSVIVPRAVCPPIQMTSQLLVGNKAKHINVSPAMSKQGIVLSGEDKPLYESIYSMAGSPGKPKLEPGLLSEQLLHDPLLGDQIRRQVEFTIMRNEAILRGAENLVVKDARRKQNPQTMEANSSLPLNLSVRKPAQISEQQFGSSTSDLHIPLLRQLHQAERRQQTPPPVDRSAAMALESLMAKTGRDLEITKRIRKTNSGQARRQPYDKPPVVNMTPIYKQDHLTSSAHLDMANYLLGKRKMKGLPEEISRLEVNKKARMEPLVSPPPTDSELSNSTVKSEALLDNRRDFADVVVKQEEDDRRKKIENDCKLALMQDVHGNYPLHNSVLMQNLNLVRRFSKVLGALGRSVDLVNLQGRTPLHLAVKEESSEVIVELLSQGADPAVTDTSGDTVFHMAVRVGAVKNLATILKRRPSRKEIDNINDEGLTALHLAVLSGDETVLKMLLAYGARVDVQELKNGRSSLFLAVERGRQSIVELLLCYGGSVGLPNYSGLTPLGLCSEYSGGTKTRMGILLGQGIRGKGDQGMMDD